MSPWSASRPRAHDHHWSLSKTPLRYPAVAQSHGELVDTVPQNQSHHTLQQVIYGVEVRVSKPKAKVVDLGER